MLYDRGSLLTAEERKTPLNKLQELVFDYKFHELHELISTMVEICLTTDNIEFSESLDRADLLDQGRHLLKTVEVAYILAEQSSQEKQS